MMNLLKNFRRKLIAKIIARFEQTLIEKRLVDLERLGCDKYFMITESIDDYVLGNRPSLKRHLLFYSNVSIITLYMCIALILMNHNDDESLSMLGDFWHCVFNIKVIAGAFFYLELFILSMMIGHRYFEINHQLHYMYLLHTIRYSLHR